MSVTPGRRRLLLALGAAFVLVCLVGAGVVLGDRWRTDDGPDHPDAWDPRVAEYAEVVEDERDLEFEHPIHVDFLPVEEFKKQVTADEEDLTEEDREELEQTAGLFRALGLVEGELDLFDTMNELQQAGVVGYYSYDDERIRIRGTELTPAVRSTLVHELTHALQDQHFDLGARKEELEEAEDSAGSSGFDAIVEGDARRIETAWREELDEDDREALEEDEERQLDGFEDDSAGVPDVLETLMAAPYVFGEALLQVAVEQGGDGAVDDLFEQPPTTEEHQLDPWTLVEDEQEALDVPEPEPGDGAEEFDDGPFGALSWLLVLAERIPVKQALVAADGWGGDAYVAYERDGISCVEVSFQGDTAADKRQMLSALRAWTARLPEAPASVRVDGDVLRFVSCDPGAGAEKVATGGSRDAVSLALSRTYLSATLVGSGFEPAPARCSADRLVRTFTIEELNSPSVDQARVQEVIASCMAQEG